MKNLILPIAILLGTTSTVLAETATFNVTVTIPNQVAMPNESQGIQTKLVSDKNVQIQSMVRNERIVMVRSIVVL